MAEDQGPASLVFVVEGPNDGSRFEHLVRVLEKTVKFQQTAGADPSIKFIPIRWVKKMLPEAQGKGSRWDPLGLKRCALDFAISKVIMARCSNPRFLKDARSTIGKAITKEFERLEGTITGRIVVSFVGHSWGSVLLYEVLKDTEESRGSSISYQPRQWGSGELRLARTSGLGELSGGLFMLLGSPLASRFLLGEDNLASTEQSSDVPSTKLSIKLPVINILDPADPCAYRLKPLFYPVGDQKPPPPVLLPRSPSTVIGLLLSPWGQPEARMREIKLDMIQSGQPMCQDVQLQPKPLETGLYGYFRPPTCYWTHPDVGYVLYAALDGKTGAARCEKLVRLVQPVVVWLVVYALMFLWCFVGLEMWKEQKPLAIVMLALIPVSATVGSVVMWTSLMATRLGDEGWSRLSSWLRTCTWHHEGRTQRLHRPAQQMVTSRGEYDEAVQ